MASYNRYQGNTGRVTRVDERRAERPPEVQGNQFSENPRSSGDENGKMQFYECFLHIKRI